LRRLLLSIIGVAIVIFQTAEAQEGERQNFEVLFSGNGDINSYIYFDQSAKFLIDTELNASVETFRYKRLFLAVDLFEETAMGRKPVNDPSKTDMVFDPNKGHWSFGLTGRFEFPAHFLETQYHHDCFHGIDRFGYEPTPTNPAGRDSTKYWNALRFGFGSLGYLPKYRYHQPDPRNTGIYWANQLNYLLLASFFAPRGYSWQKYHGYDFTLNTNLHYLLLRFKRIGFDIESLNLWVVDYKHNVKRRHEMKFNFTIYGKRGALMTYIGWWPYDDQSIRNRDGKTVFGIHLGF